MEWARARLSPAIEHIPAVEARGPIPRFATQRVEVTNLPSLASSETVALAHAKPVVDKGNTATIPKYEVEPRYLAQEDLRTVLQKEGGLPSSTGLPADELDWDMVVGTAKPWQKQYTTANGQRKSAEKISDEISGRSQRHRLNLKGEDFNAFEPDQL